MQEACGGRRLGNDSLSLLFSSCRLIVRPLLFLRHSRRSFSLPAVIGNHLTPHAMALSNFMIGSGIVLAIMGISINNSLHKIDEGE